jgi:uncharacterized protein (DUF58 family)
MSPSLDPKLAKALRGECRSCPDPALPGSYWCGPHTERERSQGAARQAARRDRLRAEKRCLDCGVSVRSVGLVRCADCRKANTENRARVTDSDRSVTDKGVISHGGHFKLQYDPRRPGPAQRYVGRSHRGAPTTEERNAELLRDAEYARQALGRFVRAFDIATSDEVAALPRFQREEAMREAASFPAQAARILAGIVERLDTRARAECCVCGGSKQVNEESI